MFVSQPFSQAGERLQWFTLPLSNLQMGNQPNSNSNQNLAAEFDHYRKIINAFDEYRRYSLAVNNRRRKDFYKLSRDDQGLLQNYPSKLNEVDDRIRRNADVLDEIVFQAEKSGLGPRIPSEHAEVHLPNEIDVEDPESQSDPNPQVRVHDAEKVRSTLRQLVRDWSILGSAEREACYSPILDRLEEFAASTCQNGSQKRDIKILVPGSGLGRLVWEIANRVLLS